MIKTRTNNGVQSLTAGSMLELKRLLKRRQNLCVNADMSFVEIVQKLGIKNLPAQKPRKFESTSIKRNPGFVQNAKFELKNLKDVTQ